MLILYQPKSAWGLPNLSPFCMKLETYLRMVDIPFKVESNFNMLKTPKGKVPYIEDNGQCICDTGFIIEYLKKTYGDPLDKELNAEGKAIVLAFRRLVEEHLYWPMVYSRWIEEENFAQIKEIFFGKMPGPMKFIVPKVAIKKVKSQLKGHGMGLHRPAEVYQLGNENLQALSDFLADKPFFMGEQPTSLDATTYSFLAGIYEPPLSSPLKDYMKSLDNLVSYCERMKAQYYSNK